MTKGGRAFFGILIFCLFLGGVFVAKTKGWIGEKAADSIVPTSADLPGAIDQRATGGGDITIPGPRIVADHDPCIMSEVWEWNAQQGAFFANGGKVTHDKSINAKYGICVHYIRQDDTEKMKADLIKFAQAVAQGNQQPTEGATFVSIMGDGAGQFLASIEPVLEKLGPKFRAKVVASFGFSRGEDKFMAPPACANALTKKERQEACKGLVIAGVIKDGDWNIAMKFAHGNDIHNNPDPTTYDPEAFNWINAKDYIAAGDMYIAGYCEDRAKVINGRKTGDKVHVCLDGVRGAVVTWTPGDVNVTEKKGGLQTVVSTKEYSMQMPHVLIGIDQWMQDNHQLVVNYIDAALEGGRQVQISNAALDAASVASADIYADQDAAYWEKYYRGVSEQDFTHQLTVSLGGSKVNNLPEDARLFGLDSHFANAFAATYTTFGNIAHQQYPQDIASFPAVDTILDTSYLKDAVAAHPTSTARAEVVSYSAPSPISKEIGSQSWHINFKSGKATFTPDAQGQLKELFNNLVIAGNTVIRIEGHTDNTGTDDGNQTLSKERADAVRAWLQQKAAGNFPDNRLSTEGFGASKPTAPNTTNDGRAKNRRVEIRLLKT